MKKIRETALRYCGLGRVHCIITNFFKRKINLEFSLKKSVKIHGDVARLVESNAFSRFLSICDNKDF